MAQQLKALIVLPGPEFCSLHPRQEAHTAPNSSTKAFYTLFWPPWVFSRPTDTDFFFFMRTEWPLVMTVPGFTKLQLTCVSTELTVVPVTQFQ